MEKIEREKINEGKNLFIICSGEIVWSLSSRWLSCPPSTQTSSSSSSSSTSSSSYSASRSSSASTSLLSSSSWGGGACSIGILVLPFTGFLKLIFRKKHNKNYLMEDTNPQSIFYGPTTKVLKPIPLFLFVIF